MMTSQKRRYLELAKSHTESELAELLSVRPRTVRRYAQQTGTKPKPTKYQNISIEQWETRFKEQYAGRLALTGPITKDRTGHVHGTCGCLTCGHTWDISLNAKLNQNTGCIICDKGHWGNKYTASDVAKLLNRFHHDQWELVSYGHYSKKDSVVRCKLCGHTQTVNLNNFLNATSTRCTTCQTGSFGEYVISTTLRYNQLPFEREKVIRINHKRYRLDFLVNNRIALEYSGLQHFQEGLYYNPEINEGVELKRQWCGEHGYEFIELRASRRMDQIIQNLSIALGLTLRTPPPEFFEHTNPDMSKVLAYMRTHSARQTSKDLNVPMSKIKHYVFLAGYASISDWQSDNHRP